MRKSFKKFFRQSHLIALVIVSSLEMEKTAVSIAQKTRYEAKRQVDIARPPHDYLIDSKAPEAD